MLTRYFFLTLQKSELGYQDEAVTVKNMKEITVVSKLLKVGTGFYCDFLPGPAFLNISH